MEVIGDGVVVNLAQRSLLGADRAGEITEVIHRQRNIGIQGLPDRLAVIPRLSERDLLQIFLDPIGDLVQDHRSVGHRGLTPGRGRGMCSVQRQLDIGRGGTCHLAVGLTGHR